MSYILDPKNCKVLYATAAGKSVDTTPALVKLAREYGVTVDFVITKSANFSAAVKTSNLAPVTSTALLAGEFLEDLVTVLALSALSEGLDVHVVVDQCLSNHEDLSSLILARLIQAGVVPVTLDQVRYEFQLSTEIDQQLP